MTSRLQTYCSQHDEHIDQYRTQHWLAGRFIITVEVLWNGHQVLFMAQQSRSDAHHVDSLFCVGKECKEGTQKVRGRMAEWLKAASNLLMLAVSANV